MTSTIGTADEDGSARASALIEAIYHSTADPADWLVLRDRMMQSCREAPVYTPQQRRFAESILGHIQRALKLADSRERLTREHRQLQQLVEAVAPAICIVRPDGTPVSANRAALAMFPQSARPSPLNGPSPPDGPYPLNGPSPLDGPDHGTASRATLKDALATATKDGYACACIPSDCAEEALLVHVGKLASQPQPLLAIVIFPQRAPQQAAVAQFATQYRLTDKEHKVLMAALRSPRLQDVAVTEGISYHTVRQHLKSIYDKTGASSQAELLAGLMQHLVVREAVRTESTDLLPHARMQASSTTLNVGSRQRPRILSYAEYGDPNGTPVLYFHTLTGSRLELALHDAQLRNGAIRLIAMDRPGFGASDKLEYETYETLTHDVRALLDRLRLPRAGLLACSAGTPHALSAAARLQARVSLVQCVGGVPPLDHMMTKSSNVLLYMAQTQLFRVAPRLMRPGLELLLRRASVQSMYQAMLGSPSKLFRYAPKDIEYINQSDHLAAFVASGIEAIRQGTQAWAQEAALINQPWQIPFEQTECPVHFWHGQEDFLFPAETIKSFANEFPWHQLTVVEGETHFMVHRHLARILPAFHEHP